MKKKLFSLFLLFFSITLFSQDIPVIKTEKETISVKKIKVETVIIGDIAVTTYDMQFYNPKNRVLEGELSFPLGENQSVTRFALDIDGKLREAVVVEKEKARVAFETTVRNNIDPALLEQTKGNNYKARIYPIPSKGYKRVVLAYQQKLIINNGSYYYKIPFSFKNKLEEFSLSVSVLNQKNKPTISKGFLNDFKFNAKENSYTAKINRRKYKVAKPVIIKIPLNPNKEKLIESNEYFYFTSKLDITHKKNEKAKEITLFWDTSLSQESKKINSEIKFLEAYFLDNKNLKVNLVLFNLKKHLKKTFFVSNSNWESLKNELLNVVYDGATSFRFLNSYKDNASENFIFTNGLNTLGELKLKFSKTTHFVNSLVASNHNKLKYLANTTGGYYINLQQSSIKDALKKLTHKPLLILGTNSSKDVEIYPKKGNIVSDNFSITGKKSSQNKNIEIYIGTAKDTLSTVRFQLKKNTNAINVLKSLWAQGKLKDLAINSKENESEIIKISKKYNVTSSFTSLLVLDRIEDYVTHEIVPPKELQKEYYKLLSLKRNNKKEIIQGLKEDLLAEYSSFTRWINEKPKELILSKNKANNASPGIIINDTINLASQRGNDFIISGNVYDSSGPLPGVAIVKKGSGTSVQTDFDGKFSLKVKGEDVLVFSFIGYETVEVNVGNKRNIALTLSENEDSLDEVVVTGLGIQRLDRKNNNSFSDIVLNSKINLKGWNPNTPYLKVLRTYKNTELAYKEYLILRKEYGSSPSFFIDVADYFKEKNQFEIAKLILSNVAEIDLSNYELLKALAYKFEEYELWDNAVFIYKEILKLRPEDIQSYRDLALAYQGAGKYQQSLDLLYKIVNGEFIEKDTNRRFKGVEVIALHELNRLINVYKENLNYSYIEDEYIINPIVDVKVVIDWNHNDTDIDLWIFEPNGEKCFYKHKKTKIGGLMSNDMTSGFGPEQYTLKKAVKGEYKIKANYYGDSLQKISGPTFLKVTTFINYGTSKEKKEVKLIRLSTKEKEIYIGNLMF